jgi:hypothetical protein
VFRVRSQRQCHRRASHKDNEFSPPHCSPPPKPAPQTVRVSLPFNPKTAPQSAYYLKLLEAAAPALALKLKALEVSTAPEIEAEIAELAKETNGGLVFLPDIFTGARATRAMINAWTAQYRWAGVDLARMQQLAKELIELRPEVNQIAKLPFGCSGGHINPFGDGLKMRISTRKFSSRFHPNWDSPSKKAFTQRFETVKALLKVSPLHIREV